VKRLLALAGSPNENEARSAAALAAKLIREHGIVLSMPRSGKTPAPRQNPSEARKTPGSKRAVRRVADAPERIASPLGGDCIHCGSRYRAGTTVYWFASGGGMHPRCFDQWAEKQGRGH
jgi:hypothetical protein